MESSASSEENVVGVIPFIEQGLLSVLHYTLVVTNKRLIFCTWNPSEDEAMSEAEDEVMQESCSISETADEITHFHNKDWNNGPWQRYRDKDPGTIADAAPGSITLHMSEIHSVDIVCETRTSTQDKLYISTGKANHEFDLMFSQGPYLHRLLEPHLGERLTIADHLHRRSKLDRLISGQEYK